MKPSSKEVRADHRQAIARVALLVFRDPSKFAGLDFAWTVEEYGNLLAIGGGKERMSHYFTVRGSGT